MKNQITLSDGWHNLDAEEKINAFRNLSDDQATSFFNSLSTHDQFELLNGFTTPEKRFWLKDLAPDDIADLIQTAEEADRKQWISLLDTPTQREIIALLDYAEDDAGGLMNPRFIRLRPDVQVDVAIRYLRAQKAHVKKIYYAYVLDSSQHLLGTVSLKDLLLADPTNTVSEIMTSSLITVPDTMDQEEVGRILVKSNLSAVPVINEDRTMVGIVSLEDIVDVVQEEATEDIHKLGGVEALDEPYLRIDILKMVKKRAGWLTILFLGEMFTATAMGHFGEEIEKATVLAFFIPLIISSGGNSGSQAASLIIRALALKEIKLRDWWRVFSREIISGFALGSILGAIGFLRIILWPNRVSFYGEHYVLIALTVAISLVGIVLWGSLCGSMLPFLLRRIGLDPATASAPFVATLVDVTGLIIYFTVASLILGGVLL